MDYEFINTSLANDNMILPNSDKINPFLLKNNYAEILKGIDFISSKEQFLHIHGFMGTGKRQYINYICEFLDKEVIKLEYYCKESTVCDDILLTFSEQIEELSLSKAVNVNTKITTLGVKFQQQISTIKRPFLIILHSLDDVLPENVALIKTTLARIITEENLKLIVSTRAMKPDVLGDLVEDRKIFLKAFTKKIFKSFLEANQINASDRIYEDFYKYTRGYYYYVALSAKIIQAMKIDLGEFLERFNQSSLSFDSFLSITYINLIPNTIRNFFWFLRTMRHGITLNALAVFELYDEFSIEYLKTNLMIFQVNETIYVQDYFLQKIDISIPEKTEIKLHKYIIGIYEKQLKANLKERYILISRQALRAEIEYHRKCILEIEEDIKEVVSTESTQEKPAEAEQKNENKEPGYSSIAKQIENAQKLAADNKNTEAIEAFRIILENEKIDIQSLVEVRLNLARLYKLIDDNVLSSHYYELVENYYLQNKELINLNYLYYEMTDLYFKMYKNERAVETIKKVIYSVDTPQSLMVNACTLLGNIYSDMSNPEEAYEYYKRALDSLDENVETSVLADLYFKYALANDDRGEEELAYEYYNKCIGLQGADSYKALAYSNLASCYFDNENFDDAKNCFIKAYQIEKANNNFDGIYYNASHLAKIFVRIASSEALDYLIEAKKSAEFINEEFYILQSSIALGDYYYNNQDTFKEALREYFSALILAKRIAKDTEIAKIESRINDMKHRMNIDDFADIEKKYGKRI